MLLSRVQTIAIRLSRFIRLKNAKRGRLISSKTLTLAYPSRFSKLFFFFSISIFETRLLKRTIIGRLPLCELGSLCAIEMSCSSTLTSILFASLTTSSIVSAYASGFPSFHKFSSLNGFLILLTLLLIECMPNYTCYIIQVNCAPYPQLSVTCDTLTLWFISRITTYGQFQIGDNNLMLKGGSKS